MKRKTGQAPDPDWLEWLQREQIRTPGRNPGLAALLSFVVMGLGQIYAGQIDRGVILLGCQVVGLTASISIYRRGIVFDAVSAWLSPEAIALAVFLGVALGILIWIFNIKDAYQLALMAGVRDAYEMRRVLLPYLRQEGLLLAGPTATPAEAEAARGGAAGPVVESRWSDEVVTRPSAGRGGRRSRRHRPDAGRAEPGAVPVPVAARAAPSPRSVPAGTAGGPAVAGLEDETVIEVEPRRGNARGVDGPAGTARPSIVAAAGAAGVGPDAGGPPTAEPARTGRDRRRSVMLRRRLRWMRRRMTMTWRRFRHRPGTVAALLVACILLLAVGSWRQLRSAASGLIPLFGSDSYVSISHDWADSGLTRRPRTDRVVAGDRQSSAVAAAVPAAAPPVAVSAQPTGASIPATASAMALAATGEPVTVAASAGSIATAGSGSGRFSDGESGGASSPAAETADPVAVADAASGDVPAGTSDRDGSPGHGAREPTASAGGAAAPVPGESAPSDDGPSSGPAPRPAADWPKIAMAIEAGQLVAALGDFETALAADPTPSRPLWQALFAAWRQTGRGGLTARTDGAGTPLPAGDPPAPGDEASLTVDRAGPTVADPAVRQQVERLFERYLHLYPNDAEAWADLGELQYHRRAFRDASRSLSRAIGLRPDHGRANLVFGLLYRDLSLAREALRYLQVALSTDPLDPEILREIGQLHLEQGQAALACQYLERALSIEPGHELTAGLLRQARAALPVVAERHAMPPEPPSAAREPDLGGPGIGVGSIGRERTGELVWSRGPERSRAGVVGASHARVPDVPVEVIIGPAAVPTPSIGAGPGAEAAGVGRVRTSGLGVAEPTGAGGASGASGADQGSSRRDAHPGSVAVHALAAAGSGETGSPAGARSANVVIPPESGLAPAEASLEPVPIPVQIGRASGAVSLPGEVAGEPVAPAIVWERGRGTVTQTATGSGARGVAGSSAGGTATPAPTSSAGLPGEARSVRADPTGGRSTRLVATASVDWHARAPDLSPPMASGAAGGSALAAPRSASPRPSPERAGITMAPTAVAASSSRPVARQDEVRLNGRELYDRGDFEHALPLLLDELRRREDPELYRMVGRAFEKLGMMSDAFDARQRERQLSAASDDLGLANLANLAARSNRHAEALPLLEAAIARLPHRLDLRLTRLECLEMVGRPADAARGIDELLQLGDLSETLRARLSRERDRLRGAAGPAVLVPAGASKPAREDADRVRRPRSRRGRRAAGASSPAAAGPPHGASSAAGLPAAIGGS